MPSTNHRKKATNNDRAAELIREYQARSAPWDDVDAMMDALSEVLSKCPPTTFERSVRYLLRLDERTLGPRCRAELERLAAKLPADDTTTDAGGNVYRSGWYGGFMPEAIMRLENEIRNSWRRYAANKTTTDVDDDHHQQRNRRRGVVVRDTAPAFTFPFGLFW